MSLLKPLTSLSLISRTPPSQSPESLLPGDVCLYLARSRHHTISTADLDSPCFFGPALSHGLSLPDPSPRLLLQYVDRLLLCSPSKQRSISHTTQPLNFLTDRKYRVTSTKAPVFQPQVTHPGLAITPSLQAIPEERKALIDTSPLPSSRPELLSFLGLASYFRIWTPSFSLLQDPFPRPRRETRKNPWTRPHPFLARSKH